VPLRKVPETKSSRSGGRADEEGEAEEREGEEGGGGERDSLPAQRPANETSTVRSVIGQ